MRAGAFFRFAAVFFFLASVFFFLVASFFLRFGAALLLLAAFFFSKSSERFDDWLVRNRLFGKIVRDWRAGLGFTIFLTGLSGAGKSTLITCVSAARPKVADYPFTTLYPNLGVVRVDETRSFVIADIPVLIEGASTGAGLGIQFLKHLSRTRLLLHILDIAPFDGSSPVDAAKKILTELQKYSNALATKERWLVLNKADLLPEDERQQRTAEITAALQWKGPVYTISALSKTGTRQVVYDIMNYLSYQREESAQDSEIMADESTDDGQD